MSLTTMNKFINDVEMGHFASSNDSLATTGIGPCIGFIILLDDYQHILIEHRSSINLPREFDLDNVRSLLKDLVRHVTATLPGLSITGVLIFGGLKDKSHFNNLHTSINKILHTDVNHDDENESIHYKQLLKNVLCNNGFHIHSQPIGDNHNCSAGGAHFNPYNTSHGMPKDSLMQRHVGDLGNIEVNADGRAYVALRDDIISLGFDKTRNVIGLPLMIHNLTDDGGHTGKGESNMTGNAGPRIACGTILLG
ncbi:unnamed protein product [Rotaria sordida]|uniref:Superoxide dismutase [Cu-Zn] n=2 Tax=Rotaria sordida TaxID=392033 RepID=A0A819LIQ5_9BILA|nr:unnamed protein product [Rotaria sordida]CAF3965774.1 unnamed protein product [Rotaria sordida]